MTNITTADKDNTVMEFYLEGHLDPSRPVEIWLGLPHSDTSQHVHTLKWSILQAFTKLQPYEFTDNRLSLSSAMDLKTMKRACRFMDMKVENPQLSLMTIRTTRRLGRALREYEVIDALAIRLSLGVRQGVETFIRSVRDGKLTFDGFKIIMESSCQCEILRKAAIEGVEARYQEGLRGGYEGVSERWKIAFYAAQEGISIDIGIEWPDYVPKDVPERIDSPLVRTGR